MNNNNNRLDKFMKRNNQDNNKNQDQLLKENKESKDPQDNTKIMTSKKVITMVSKKVDIEVAVVVTEAAEVVAEAIELRVIMKEREKNTDPEGASEVQEADVEAQSLSTEQRPPILKVENKYKKFLVRRELSNMTTTTSEEEVHTMGTEESQENNITHMTDMMVPEEVEAA